MTLTHTSRTSRRAVGSGVLPTAPAAPPRELWSANLTPSRACAVPLAFILALGVLGFVGPVGANPHLAWAFGGAAAVLVAWNALLYISALRTRRAFTLAIVPRKQHYIQACAQGSMLVFWGWYWQPVYESAPLILGQVMFAYAFDMLLAWSRRDSFTLGFGVLPVIFSINLFLWFKPDWFYLQFLMVALGFAAKKFIRWNKDGRRVHIFNPSAFTLAVFSVGVLLTGSSGTTWGVEIAESNFCAPNSYLFIFLIGLPGQFLFGVTTMTMSAVLTTYLFGLAYFILTGTYFFFDSYIPIAVFLGMHLLFTDPSTSPRSELGRIVFGVLYGLSTVLLYELLGNAGLPTFYDKLLQVPLLNLSITLIDRAARSQPLRRFDPAALGRSVLGRHRNLAYISIWVLVFGAMSAAGGVGDNHPGQYVPFWQQACADVRPYACLNLEDMESTYCARGSGWACNELGVLLTQMKTDVPAAADAFHRGCALGFPTGCTNAAAALAGGRTFERPAPTLADFPIVLRGTKGPNIDRNPVKLYARACEQGWPGTCGWTSATTSERR